MKLLLSYLSLICLITLTHPAYTQEDSKNQTIEKINNQIEALNGLFDDYESLSHETENVINGLSSLGMHYSKLTNSLVSTKDLIGEVLNEQERLIEENKRLQRLNNLSKDDLNDFIEYQNKKNKWNYRIEGLIINLIAAFLFGVLSHYALMKYRNQERVSSLHE